MFVFSPRTTRTGSGDSSLSFPRRNNQPVRKAPCRFCIMFHSVWSVFCAPTNTFRTPAPVWKVPSCTMLLDLFARWGLWVQLHFGHSCLFKARLGVSMRLLRVQPGKIIIIIIMRLLFATAVNPWTLISLHVLFLTFRLTPVPFGPNTLPQRIYSIAMWPYGITIK